MKNGLIVDDCGNKFYYLDGKLHRIEWDNDDKFWYFNGKHHRLDGPAIEWKNGDRDWCINNELLSKEEFNRHPKRIMYLVKEWVKNIFK